MKIEMGNIPRRLYPLLVENPLAMKFLPDYDPPKKPWWRFLLNIFRR